MFAFDLRTKRLGHSGLVGLHSLLLRCTLALDKLLEGTDGHMSKAPVVPLGHEPVQDLFEGLLSALLVGQSNRLARLLVQSSQRVG